MERHLLVVLPICNPEGAGIGRSLCVASLVNPLLRIFPLNRLLLCGCVEIGFEIINSPARRCDDTPAPGFRAV